MRRIATVVALSAAIGMTAAPALAATSNPAHSGLATSYYLSLGDSLAQGVQPNAAGVSVETDQGYADQLYASLRVGDPGLQLVKLGCPGETTGSMISGGICSYPQGSQLAAAVSFLQAHPGQVSLVTIDIGANDVFLCQETTADACASTPEFDAVLQEIGANLTTIYTLIRDVARYHGLLVALTYYSTSYSNPPSAQEAGLEALDSVIASVTQKFGGKVADGFAAFEGPSAAFGGSACAAGLLIKLPDGTCDIHPSPAGHRLLAQAIKDVI